jgi:hypothetical protein
MARPDWPGHLLDLPEGYHTAAQGQSQTTQAPVVSRAAPGMPCGRAGTRSTRCPTPPACKIMPFPCRETSARRDYR